jgi:starch synthase
LNQMYSQRYGTIPLVSCVGGLADTVVDVNVHPDTGTGFVFSPDETGLRDGLNRSLKLYQEPSKFKATQKRGMARDFSWKLSAMDYEELYRKVLFGESQTHNPWGT